MANIIKKAHPDYFLNELKLNVNQYLVLRFFPKLYSLKIVNSSYQER